MLALLLNKAVRKTSDGRVAVILKTTDIPASAVRIGGIALDSTGAIYVTR